MKKSRPARGRGKGQKVRFQEKAPAAQGEKETGIEGPRRKRSVEVKPAIGTVGTQIFSGIITGEEFNLELTDDRGVKAYDKMIRTDAQVQAALLIVTLPLRSATWSVKPAEDNPKGEEHAELIKRMVMDSGRFQWPEFLRQMLQYLPFGFYVFEKIRKIVEGTYTIEKLVPRIPRTITGWYQNADCTLREIEQFAYFPDDVGAGTFKRVRIPNENILLFTNEQEGANYRGKSLLRSMYKNWLFKDAELRIDAIRHERLGLGVPIITLPEESSQKEQDQTDAEDLGENFRAHEKQYVILPPGFKFEIADMKGHTLTNIMDSVKYHDGQILSGVLAQFLELGKTDTGSRSVGEVHSNTFYNSLQAVAETIENVLNNNNEGRSFVEEIIRFNFGEQESYPRIVCSKISNIDWASVSAVMKNLMDGQILRPYDELEKYVAKELDLPDPPDREKERKDKPKPPVVPGGIPAAAGPEGEAPEKEGGAPSGGKAPTEEPGAAEGKDGQEKRMRSSCRHTSFFDRAEDGGQPAASEIGYWRPLTELESRIELKEMDIDLREFVNQLDRIGDTQRKAIVKFLADEAVKILSSNTTPEQFKQKIFDTKIPEKKMMSVQIGGTLRNVFDYGKRRVVKELGVGEKMMRESPEFAQKFAAEDPGKKKKKRPLEPIYDDEAEMIGTVQIVSETAVYNLTSKLTAEWRKEMIAQRSAGVIDTASLTETLLNLSLREYKREMREAVNQVFGFGRNDEARKRQDEIVSIIRSEVMDEKTCGPCEAIDGTEFSGPDDQGFSEFAAGPYTDCEGGQLCRGINIYVRRGEG